MFADSSRETMELVRNRPPTWLMEKPPMRSSMNAMTRFT
jgi:hypothetical protein